MRLHPRRFASLASHLPLWPLLLLLPPFQVACDGTSSNKDQCKPPKGAGTMHQGVISADETWSAATSPHVVTFSLFVTQGTLTIEPCAVVRVQEGITIRVGGNAGTPEAAIVAHGATVQKAGGATVVRPVVFIPDQAGTHWGSILVNATGRLDLEHVDITGGGEQSSAQGLGGTIMATGDGGPTLNRMLRLVSVLIDQSGGFGVNLTGFAAFTEDSRDLTIKGSGQQPSGSGVSTDFPIHVSPPAVQTLPTGTYTGNKVDEIQVFNQSQVHIDETFRDRGVPYRMQTAFAMVPNDSAANGGLVTLTIEAGVTLKFNPDPANKWAFDLGSSNGTLPSDQRPVRLIADGTAEKPVVFTSAGDASGAQAAGDWGGSNGGLDPRRETS